MRCVPSIAFQGANRSLFRWHGARPVFPLTNRMRVESLFIDEGFGSLDAETLRVAMDALESLRTQGRKDRRHLACAGNDRAHPCPRTSKSGRQWKSVVRIEN